MSEQFLIIILYLTLIYLGGSNWLPCGFFKNISSVERVESSFFVTFNIILKHIFPENLIEFPEDIKKFSVNISNFH